jgi:hypothetical protein
VVIEWIGREWWESRVGEKSLGQDATDLAVVGTGLVDWWTRLSHGDDDGAFLSGYRLPVYRWFR